MALNFDDINNDPKLDALFSEKDLPCVFQMWFLECKSEKSLRYDFLYARLIPYHTSKNAVFVSNSSSCYSNSQTTAKIFSVSYYLTSSKTKNFFKALFSGLSLEELNHKYSFNTLGNKTKTEFFKSWFVNNENLTFSNVYFCLNKSNFTNNKSFSSPLDDGGCVCASVWLNERFNIVKNWNPNLYQEILKQLFEETGVNFKERKNWERLCSFEFYNFPSINQFEQQLFNVEWLNHGMLLSYIPSTGRSTEKYLFSFTAFNGQNEINSWIENPKIDTKGQWVSFIHLTEKEIELIDGYDIKLYKQNDPNSSFSLLFHQQLPFIKEVSFTINANSGDSAIWKNSWLEKALPKKFAEEIRKVQTIGRVTSLTDTVNARKIDNWSIPNREFKDYLLQNFPEPSNGKFFPRIKDQITSRLEFVKWFKNIFSNFKNCEVFLFDPFFDFAGFYLLTLSSLPSSTYQVYTRLEEKKENGGQLKIEKIKKGYEKIKNIIPHRLNLTIYGLPSHLLHDRYILFLNNETKAIKGFQLSNSLEKQSERHPLLVTPIPQDIIHDLWNYTQQLINSENCIEIFDPSKQEVKPSVLTIFDKEGFGQLCTEIFQSPCLKELTGHNLMIKMVELNLYNQKPGSFAEYDNVVNFLDSFNIDSIKLLPKWNLYADLLAHTPYSRVKEHNLSKETINFLITALKHQLQESQVLAVSEEKISGGTFSLTEEEFFLHCKTRPCFYHLKPKIVTWSEFYSITLIGINSLNDLLEIFDNCGSPKTLKAQRLYECAYQIITSLTLSQPMNYETVKLLLNRNNDWIKSIGYSSITEFCRIDFNKNKLENFFNEIPLNSVIACLVWCVLYFWNPIQKSGTFEYFAQKLIRTLPENGIDNGENEFFLRFFMKSTSTGWWSFKEVLLPVIEKRKLSESKVLEYVMNRLLTEFENGSLVSSLFRNDYSILPDVVNLLANTDRSRLNEWIKHVKDILKSKEKIVSKPLIRNCNYDKWNDAMSSLLQIFICMKLLSAKLSNLGDQSNDQIYEIQSRAELWIKLRPFNEWGLFNSELLKKIMNY